MDSWPFAFVIVVAQQNRGGLGIIDSHGTIERVSGAHTRDESPRAGRASSDKGIAYICFRFRNNLMAKSAIHKAIYFISKCNQVQNIKTHMDLWTEC